MSCRHAVANCTADSLIARVGGAAVLVDFGGLLSNSWPSRQVAGCVMPSEPGALETQCSRLHWHSGFAPGPRCGAVPVLPVTILPAITRARMRSLTYFSLTKPCVRQNTQVQLAADRLAAVDKAAAMAAAALKPVVAAHARQLVHEGLQLCCMRPAVCRRRQHNGGLFRTMWPSMAGRRRSGCVRALSSAELHHVC